MRKVVLAFLLLFALPLLADTPAGRWTGTIKLPTTTLDIDVDLESTGTGWKGDITIPAQGARDLPLTVAVDGAKVRFSINGVPGDPTFTGTLDGDKLAGDFAQGGGNSTFALTRGAKVETAAKLAGIDDTINAALKSWQVPGLAVAVIADGKLAWSKGFGHRDVEKNLPMTADTLLPIGSITKSFTTLLMGMLVDEGKLEWDKPVRGYVPEFRAADELLTARLTPRDLVTHRTGLPRHDLVWYNNKDLTRTQIVERLSHLGASEDLRTRYQYNNLMFLAGGFLVEEITGKPWEDVTRERVFGPLGMARSTFSDAEAEKDADHARGYREEDDKLLLMPFREVGNMGPVGSISSSANEMAKYALLHLNRGKAEGKQLVQPGTIREMHTPQMAVGALPDQPELGPASYGLGWMIDTYRGKLRVAHGGNIDGFSALLTMFPNDNVAVVTLSNANGTAIPGLVRNHIVDKLLDLPSKDWLGEAYGRRQLSRQANKAAEEKKTSTRKSGTRPSHPIADYAGEYEHPGYGIVRIEKLTGDKLQATYNRNLTPLEHWHYDVFNGVENPSDPTFEDMKYHFRSDLAGNIAMLEASFEPRVDPIVFRKRPEARLSDPAHLQQFLGDYVLGPQPINLSLRGTKLVLTVGNQPPYELLPDIDGWYNLKGLSGFRARLTGETIEMAQPNGLFTATRKK
ncbi:MAG TPA: serine hydrolase [Thermoanaerobaculia bacterium]|nr:serine hydrolase [Thermoanaerobaculia bacterium]